jgi:hypothetical protein
VSQKAHSKPTIVKVTSAYAKYFGSDFHEPGSFRSVPRNWDMIDSCILTKSNFVGVEVAINNFVIVLEYLRYYFFTGELTGVELEIGVAVPVLAEVSLSLSLVSFFNCTLTIKFDTRL